MTTSTRPKTDQIVRHLSSQIVRGRWQAGAQLMMKLPSAERPDALVIADDHLVESANAGLYAPGVRVPDDVTVDTHRNFPDHPPTAVPVRWVGASAGQLPETGLNLIVRRLDGDAVPATTIVPTVFEREAGGREAGVEPMLCV